MRDEKGRFIKGAKLSFNNKENRTEKQKKASLENLKEFIGRIPPMTGKKHSEETKNKMSEVALSKISEMTDEERKKRFGVWKNIKGENNPNYISDRSLLKKHNRRSDPAYKNWRLEVYKRDNYKCRICNEYCEGRIEAHHILSWRDFPELRYEVNNGITLCHAHHPRARAEEKRLISYFKELVSVSS